MGLSGSPSKRDAYDGMGGGGGGINLLAGPGTQNTHANKA